MIWVVLTGAELRYLILVFSAYVYSVFAVRRLIMLINADPLLYQIINSLLAVSLTIFIALGAVDSANKLTIYMFASVVLQCSVTIFSLILRGYPTATPFTGSSANAPNTLFEGLAAFKDITIKSFIAFGYQAVQISFSFVIVQSMQKAGLSLKQIGYFSVAYSICGCIYAPATVFGSNIVAHLYQANGVVDVKRIHKLAKLVAVFTFFTSGLAVLQWWFKIFQPSEYSGFVVLLAMLCPLLAAARLVVPVAIWIGDLGFLIVGEFLKILIALILILFWLNETLVEVFFAIATAEAFLSVVCFIYFLRIKKRIIACT
jgi:hypothetical protein